MLATSRAISVGNSNERKCGERMNNWTARRLTWWEIVAKWLLGGSQLWR